MLNYLICNIFLFNNLLNFIYYIFKLYKIYLNIILKLIILFTISDNNRELRPDSLTFPAPVGVQKNPRFLRKFQICGLITLLLDIVRRGQGGFWGGFTSWGGGFWGVGDTLKKGSKMAKNGQKWPKMAKNGLFGGSLGKPPPPPFLRFKSCLKTPVFAKRAIFQDFWNLGGVEKGSFLGFWSKIDILGVKFGVQKVVKNGNFGDFWGVKKGPFWGSFFHFLGVFWGA